MKKIKKINYLCAKNILNETFPILLIAINKI